MRRSSVVIEKYKSRKTLRPKSSSDAAMRNAQSSSPKSVNDSSGTATFGFVSYDFGNVSIFTVFTHFKKEAGPVIVFAIVQTDLNVFIVIVAH